MFKLQQISGARIWTTAEGGITSDARAQADEEGLPWRRAARRQVLPLLLACLCLFLMRDRLVSIDTTAVWAALNAVTAAQWLAALTATGVSFWALGHYDAVILGALRLGVGPRAAARAGMAAIAVRQTVGLGLITGALVRWRLLPGLSLAQATKLTLAVSLTFLAGWAVVTALAIVFLLPVQTTFAAPLHMSATLVLSLAGFWLGLCLWQPRWRIFGGRNFWPPVLTLGRILGLTALDTLAAGCVLFVLLPDSAALGYGSFLPVYLLALGAGLLLGTPGGIGPFEIAMVTLLPGLSAEPLAAAILAYRALYFALPAGIAGLVLILARSEITTAPQPAGAGWLTVEGPESHLPAALSQASCAEMLLFRQGMHRLFLDPQRQDGWLAGQAGQMLVGLFDPISGAGGTQRLLPAFARAARAEDRLPCLYKIRGRSAVLARGAGWSVQPVAQEYWLRPAEFSPDGPARASLRRKLRHAAAAGIRVTGHGPGAAGDILPWDEMACIAGQWQRLRGGERGFSMGRFAPGYLAGQRLYLAWAEGCLLGFASFHPGAREWTLDLMRQREGCPDGTIHSLILAAIGDAARAGIARLSLAAAPLPNLGLSGPLAGLAGAMTLGSAAAGLSRFKETFAPETSRLYLAAPSRAALVLGAAEIARAIRFPHPLPFTALAETTRDTARGGSRDSPPPCDPQRSGSSSI